jgi:hypothetical protein
MSVQKEKSLCLSVSGRENAAKQRAKSKPEKIKGA